jgi:hypothetical protein
MTKGFFKYAGGDEVKYGFYWNVREWEAQVVPREGGKLAGDRDIRYIRMPLLAFFLPFIGFAMLAMFLVGRVRRMVTGTPPAVGAAGTAAEQGHHDTKKAA